MSKNIKCALYARTSKILKQDPKLQLVAMREYAGSKGIEIVHEFVDQITGAKEKRPALDALVVAARKKEFNVLIVSAIDRIGRNCKHLVTLIDELQGYGVSLISLRESIDLTTPMGKAVFQILSAIAELEKNIISERIRVALASKKILAETTNNGWRCGRPPLLAETNDKIMALHKLGRSIRAIAKELGIGKTSVERAIRGHR
jgi:DNA invertase Pin-like site-specific DNA recombinase